VASLCREADELIAATDAGREGELIFRYILEYAGCPARKHSRLWLSSLTDEAIRQACRVQHPPSQITTTPIDPTQQRAALITGLMKLPVALPAIPHQHGQSPERRAQQDMLRGTHGHQRPEAATCLTATEYGKDHPEHRDRNGAQSRPWTQARHQQAESQTSFHYRCCDI
jgi:hypothetical protein